MRRLARWFDLGENGDGFGILMALLMLVVLVVIAPFWLLFAVLKRLQDGLLALFRK